MEDNEQSEEDGEPNILVFVQSTLRAAACPEVIFREHRPKFVSGQSRAGSPIGIRVGN